MTFHPAPPNSGIRFRRMDLDGKPEIEARLENVAETNRSTTLAKGSARIHTVEHVLASFSGYGISNAIVELDSNEPPVGDGSAREYCRMIQSAGIAAQDEKREPISVAEPIELSMGDTVMAIFPDDAFRISCTSADAKGRFSQFFSLEMTPKAWERELSHARTFCFYEEIEYLIKNGLIKGGSLENAVVIRDDAVLTNEPLRYQDEFVRHKMLDILGDLSLLGQPLRGHLIAVKPSHSANCEFGRRIQASFRKPFMAAQAFAPPPDDSDGSASQPGIPTPQNGGYDIQGVMRMLPHRYPFLMVDKVTSIEENRIVALKNVSYNEPYFQGHFPRHPVMPGVLQLEAIAQVAGILMLRRAEDAGKIAYFMSAESVKWRKPVRPGDTLIIEVEMMRMRGKIGKAKGTCKVQGEIVSEAEVVFMIGAE
jgi:UDP-3-O-[3-hydroxymyristoyl] N-acetylglucosamine deacetylase/3-hydroxyacyl-[acyl-carrier-protein] dehydratase